jgi:hypothetical protein
MSLRAVWVGGLCLALSVAGLSAQRDRVASEVDTLLREAASVLPEQSRPAVVARLERSRAALAAGHLYLALYDLQPGFEGIAGYRLAATDKEVPDHDTFTRKWTELGAPADPPAQKSNVLFVEALAQSAEGRAPATYRASLPYARDAGLQAGLYYLGESHAMVKFAALCRSLDLPPAGRAPAIGSIETALAAYERDVVKAYDTAPGERRPQYAGVNVAIKLARTLNEQQRHEGALLQYLVSRYRYGMIVNADRPALPPEALKARIAGMKRTPGVDHSIADFFIQLAEATSGGQGGATASAAVILDDILPAYFSVVKP